jgi:hypothetical protein
MPDIYDLESETPNAVGMGWGIMAQRIKRRQIEMFGDEL